MNEDTSEPLPAELLVCVKCRRGREYAEGRRLPGKRLLENLIAAGPENGLAIVPVECMSNCAGGCTVALRGRGRWTYIFGNLHEVADVDTILDGASRYRASADGLVPWRQRPKHFRQNCVARVPPLEAARV